MLLKMLYKRKMFISQKRLCLKVSVSEILVQRIFQYILLVQIVVANLVQQVDELVELEEGVHDFNIEDLDCFINFEKKC